MRATELKARRPQNRRARAAASMRKAAPDKIERDVERCAGFEGHVSSPVQQCSTWTLRVRRFKVCGKYK